MSLGVFAIDDTDVDDSGDDLTIRVAGMDRSARVIDARFESAGSIAVTDVASLEGAIATLIRQAYPDVAFDFDDGAALGVPLVWEEAADRWAYAQDIARSLGKELFFDRDGALQLRPVVIAGSGTPSAALVEGDDGVLLSAGRSWSREGTFNRWIVTGESTDPAVPPARGEALDNNPLSPTYYYGPFGKSSGLVQLVVHHDRHPGCRRRSGDAGETARHHAASVVRDDRRPETRTGRHRPDHPAACRD